MLMRNDLLGDRPALPSLLEPPELADLYFTEACDWGDVPNFLPAPDGPVITASVGPGRKGRVVDVQGRAPDADRVLLTAGDRVVASIDTTVRNGFAGSRVISMHGPLHVYAQYAGGQARLLGPPAPRPEVLVQPDGTSVRVDATRPATGAVDLLDARKGRVATVDLPAGLEPDDVRALTFTSDGPRRAQSGIAVTDSLIGGTGRYRTIRFDALPVGGERLAVRVGSCLQWHGFEGDELYVFHRGSRPVREVGFITGRG